MISTLSVFKTRLYLISVQILSNFLLIILHVVGTVQFMVSVIPFFGSLV